MLSLYADAIIFRLQRAGGISSYWYELMRRALADDEADVTFLLSQNEKHLDNIYYSDLRKLIRKCIYERWDSALAESLFRATLPARKRREPAVFHSSYFRTTKARGFRNVVTVHDFTHQLYLTGYQRVRNTVLKRRALNDASGIVCVSKNTKNDLIRLFPEVSHKPIAVIPNACAEDYKINREAELPKPCAGIRDVPFLLYVGSRASYKNFSFAIQVIKRMKRYFLVAVGGGAFTSDEREMLGDDMSRAIQVEGLRNDELNAVYNHAHALLYPSLYEGFGIPLLEAMRAGCPVIAFNNSSVPEVLGDAGLMVNDNDLESCIDAVEKMENKTARSETICKEQSRADLFSWDRSYATLRKFYSSISCITDDMQGQ